MKCRESLKKLNWNLSFRHAFYQLRNLKFKQFLSYPFFKAKHTQCLTTFTYIASSIYTIIQCSCSPLIFHSQFAKPINCIPWENINMLPLCRYPSHQNKWKTNMVCAEIPEQPANLYHLLSMDIPLLAPLPFIPCSIIFMYMASDIYKSFSQFMVQAIETQKHTK